MSARLARQVAFLAILTVGLIALAEATQNRPDARVADSETTIEFTVSTRDYTRGEAAAALALWTVCSATVGGEVSATPVAMDGRWEVDITPAIGEHGENRLVGCLEDVTLDRVMGDVVAVHKS